MNQLMRERRVAWKKQPDGTIPAAGVNSSRIPPNRQTNVVPPAGPSALAQAGTENFRRCGLENVNIDPYT